MKPPIFLTALLLLAKGCEVLAQQFECYSQSSPGLYATSYIQPTGQCSGPAVIKPIVSSIEPTLAAPAASNYRDYGSYPFMPPSMPPIIITRDDDDDFYHLMYFLIFALSKNRDRGCGYAYNNGNGGCGSNGCCGGNCGCSCSGNGYPGNGYGGNNYGGSNCGGNNCGGNNCGGNNCGGNNNGVSGNGGNYGNGDYGFGNYDSSGGNGYGYSGVPAYDTNANYAGNNINNSGTEIRYIPFPIAVPMDTLYSLPSFSYPNNIPLKPDFNPSPGPVLPPCNCDCEDPNIYLTIKTCDCQ